VNIVVTGGTGFVGQHLVAKLVEDGHAVTVLTHRRSLPEHLEGRAKVAPGSVADPASLEAAFAGADAVWHLVGIIAETRTATFEATVAQGTRNVVEACRAARVPWIGYLSAMGPAADAPSRYHRAKFAAEEAVASSGIDFVILRPSIVYGSGDGFVSMLVRMLRRSPVVPVIGDGKYRLQPVYIADLVQIASQALTNNLARQQRIDVGGPEKLEYLEILDIIMEVTELRRAVVKIPVGLVRPVVAMLEKVLRPAPLTSDQLKMLQMGSTGDISRMIEIFGVSPMGLPDGLRKYLR
jgi:NADH dehydrogenase